MKGVAKVEQGQQVIKVRADLFDPRVYLEIELYYKDVLHKIQGFGGYVAFQQFIELWGKSHQAGYLALQKAVDMLILGEASTGVNKYAYLKRRARQYLTGRGNVREVNPRPANDTIYKSIYLAEYYIKYGTMLKGTATFAGLRDFQAKNPDAFTDLNSFIKRANKLHLRHTYLERFQRHTTSNACIVDVVIADLGRRDSWFFKQIRLLRDWAYKLNRKSTVNIKILTQSEKRAKAVHGIIVDILATDKDYRRWLAGLMESGTKKSREKVPEVQNLILYNIEEIKVLNMGIQRYFMHPSQLAGLKLKKTEQAALLEIQKQLQQKGGEA